MFCSGKLRPPSPFFSFLLYWLIKLCLLRNVWLLLIDRKENLPTSWQEKLKSCWTSEQKLSSNIRGRLIKYKKACCIAKTFLSTNRHILSTSRYILSTAAWWKSKCSALLFFFPLWLQKNCLQRKAKFFLLIKHSLFF